MHSRVTRAVVAALACAASLVVLPHSAAAAPGTFTQITTPSGDRSLVLDTVNPAANTFAVSGVASPDVTSVTLWCIYPAATNLLTFKFSDPVPVTNGVFSTTATYVQAQTCRLRAVPTAPGTPSGYLGSYSGPVLRISSVATSPVPYMFGSYLAQGDGVIQLMDAGSCAVMGYSFRAAPNLQSVVGSPRCVLRLAYQAVAAAGQPTHSNVVVDGHDAFLPSGVHDYLVSTLGATVTPPTLTASLSVAPNGDVTVEETAPLVRCPGGAYPISKTECTQLLATGVTFRRATTLTRGGYQVRVRDAFISADGAGHTVALEYSNHVAGPGTGEVGYQFPTHGPGFAAAATGQLVTGLGAGAGSMFVRSDLHAVPDDPSVDTSAISWSRPPSSIAFDTNVPDYYGLRFTAAVPASGSSALGFALSDTWQTPATQAHAAAADAEMMPVPSITSPTAGAKVGHRITVVSGVVTAGANGLPASVSVNGHEALVRLTDPTHAYYTVGVLMPWGSNRLTVTAQDSAGNTRSNSVVVTNTPALVAGRARARGGTLSVQLSCQRFSDATCVGKVVVRSARGAVIGRSGTVGIARGRARTVGIRIRPGNHVVRVYLYEREINGQLVLAVVKSYRV